MEGMMLAQFLQFLFSGITVGATYALAALGFTLIYNASNVINFAQGEFIMLGGMLAVFFAQAGLPLPAALLLAILVPAVVGVLIEKFAIEPVKGAETVTLIIITIGASLVIRGLVAVTLGKGTHSLPAFSGETPIDILGATLMPQSLWVLGVTALVVVALWYYFNRTLQGKAMLATSFNRLAAELVGINTSWVLFMSFAMSAALGALGGILITPITLTSYDVGIMLGLKGFVAAVLGGLGNGLGAVVGGLLVGILEAMGAGYISSAYKDAIPFVLILFILFFMPRGLFGGKSTDRV
jgi:branched-chain amino acid transport system permease protein